MNVDGGMKSLQTRARDDRDIFYCTQNVSAVFIFICRSHNTRAAAYAEKEKYSKFSSKTFVARSAQTKLGGCDVKYNQFVICLLKWSLLSFRI